MSNITEVYFRGTTETYSPPLYQWDYGQILKFMDLNLPNSYEVQFSTGNETVTSIGDSDGVEIPDICLTYGRNVNAYVFLHQGTDDGETEFHVIIPMIQREEPSDIEPTPVQQDVITQAIALLNSAVEDAQGYASDAKSEADRAEESAESIPVDCLSYAPQTLTDEEKAQARANISAVGSSELATVATTGDYDDLIDKPTIPTVPTNVSAFTNDVGYQTASQVETAIVATSLYGVCDTGASTVQKEVSIPEVTELYEGLSIRVKFANVNSSRNPTLKLNQFDPKPIMQTETSPAGAADYASWYAGEVVSLTYDGTSWMMNDFNNNVYPTLSQAEMQAGISTVGRTITAQRLKEAVLYHGLGIVPPPSTDGTYTLKVTVSDGVATYSWV